MARIEMMFGLQGALLFEFVASAAGQELRSCLVRQAAARERT